MGGVHHGPAPGHPAAHCQPLTPDPATVGNARHLPPAAVPARPNAWRGGPYGSGLSLFVIPAYAGIQGFGRYCPAFGSVIPAYAGIQSRVEKNGYPLSRPSTGSGRRYDRKSQVSESPAVIVWVGIAVVCRSHTSLICSGTSHRQCLRCRARA